MEKLKKYRIKDGKFISGGREFFKGKKSTFEFFKNVVEKNGDIDWHDSAIEKQELEGMNLIKTKVVLL